MSWCLWLSAWEMQNWYRHQGGRLSSTTQTPARTQGLCDADCAERPGQK